MPKIINYIERVRSARSYDEVELVRLQLVYDCACKYLDIELSNARRREAVAALIFHLADEVSEPGELLKRVLALLRNAQ